MPDLAAELWAVQHLASLCSMNITNVRDAKTALGPVERGLDVVFDLDDRRVGAQHTIFHADEGQASGKRGSLARAKEEATARTTQAPFGVWGVADYRPALALFASYFSYICSNTEVSKQGPADVLPGRGLLVGQAMQMMTTWRPSKTSKSRRTSRMVL